MRWSARSWLAVLALAAMALLALVRAVVHPSLPDTPSRRPPAHVSNGAPRLYAGGQMAPTLLGEGSPLDEVLAPGRGVALAEIVLPPGMEGRPVRYAVLGPGGRELVGGQQAAGSLRVEYVRSQEVAEYELLLEVERGGIAARLLPEAVTRLGTITLVPAMAYVGEARLSSGEAIVGARMDLFLDETAVWGTSLPTDERGQFQIPLHGVTVDLSPSPEGVLARWTIRARPTGEASLGSVAARTEGLTGSHRAVFAAVPPVALRFVLDAGGAPITDVAVSWTPELVDSLWVDARLRQGSLVQQLRTNEAGIVLPNWPPSVARANVRLLVNGRDIRFSVPRSDVPQDRPLELSVEARGATLRLRSARRPGPDRHPDGTAVVQAHLATGGPVPGYLRHLVEVPLGGQSEIQLGSVPSFMVPRDPLGPTCEWVARFPGDDGPPKFQEGSSPLQHITGGWSIDVDLDPRGRSAVTPLWVHLGPTVGGAAGGPLSLTLVVASKDGRRTRFTAYPMTAAAISYGSGSAWPFGEIDLTLLQRWDARDVEWALASVRLNDGNVRSRRLSHDDLSGAVKAGGVLSLVGAEAPPPVQVLVVDSAHAPVSGALVSVMPAYADGGGEWHELRLQGLTDAAGRCTLRLLDAAAEAAFSVTDRETGRTGFARRPVDATVEVTKITLLEAEEFQCSLELPPDAVPGSESLRLVARPSWLAPTIECVRDPTTGTWRCRASYRGYRLIGYVSVQRGARRTMHVLDLDAASVQHGIARDWRAIRR